MCIIFIIRVNCFRLKIFSNRKITIIQIISLKTWSTSFTTITFVISNFLAFLKVFPWIWFSSNIIINYNITWVYCHNITHCYFTHTIWRQVLDPHSFRRTVYVYNIIVFPLLIIYFMKTNIFQRVVKNSPLDLFWTILSINSDFY